MTNHYLSKYNPGEVAFKRTDPWPLAHFEQEENSFFTKLKKVLTSIIATATL